MNFSKLIEQASIGKEYVVAVAQADDEKLLQVVYDALRNNMARFQLFGNKEKILFLLEKNATYLDYEDKIDIYHTSSSEESARMAVQSVHDGRADVLMKGNLPTAKLLKEVLNKEYGLRTNRIISQVAMFEIPTFNRPLFVTDAAMNILPSLEEKVHIIENAVRVARAIGINMPKVAPLAAVELVNPIMPAAVDGALLTQMNRRGQITNCIVDGPLGFDNAISLQSSEQKGIQSEVAGNADILLVPNIETGNVLYKSLTYFAKAKVGSVIAGAKGPIVLPSRSDMADSKFYSLALAIVAAKEKNKNN